MQMPRIEKHNKNRKKLVVSLVWLFFYFVTGKKQSTFVLLKSQINTVCLILCKAFASVTTPLFILLSVQRMHLIVWTYL